MSSVGVSFINSFLDDKTDKHTVHPLVLQVPGTWYTRPTYNVIPENGNPKLYDPTDTSAD